MRTKLTLACITILLLSVVLTPIFAGNDSDIKLAPRVKQQLRDLSNDQITNMRGPFSPKWAANSFADQVSDHKPFVMLFTINGEEKSCLFWNKELESGWNGTMFESRYCNTFQGNVYQDQFHESFSDDGKRKPSNDNCRLGNPCCKLNQDRNNFIYNLLFNTSCEDPIEANYDIICLQEVSKNLTINGQPHADFSGLYDKIMLNQDHTYQGFFSTTGTDDWANTPSIKEQFGESTKIELEYGVATFIKNDFKVKEVDLSNCKRLKKCSGLEISLGSASFCLINAHVPWVHPSESDRHSGLEEDLVMLSAMTESKPLFMGGDLNLDARKMDCSKLRDVKVIENGSVAGNIDPAQDDPITNSKHCSEISGPSLRFETNDAFIFV